MQGGRAHDAPPRTRHRDHAEVSDGRKAGQGRTPRSGRTGLRDLGGRRTRRDARADAA
ncbi:hypothetical protein RHCRD62_40117 [Rhodococcus sp. RD6.2]|nr:hypothetical protein RHCRD62_40117 [Rhodococcus sp. RD6.2]